MKLNQTTFKIMAAFIIIAGLIFWVVSSVSPQQYDGQELNFDVGSGEIAITNPSDQDIPVQFRSSGTRTFQLRSSIDGVFGNSSREGTGNTSHVFDFALPAGTSEFTVTRGTNVVFVASAPVVLEATVNSMTADSARITIIATIFVILGLLYYASSLMEHRWIHMLRGNRENITDSTPIVESTAQGSAARSFGDNRADTNK